MKRSKKAEKGQQKELASERIERLFLMADESALSGDIGKANRYVKLAREIGMKFNVRIPRTLKRKFCKFCYSYMLPGKTSGQRVNPDSKRAEVTCLKCGRKMYYPTK